MCRVRVAKQLKVLQRAFRVVQRTFLPIAKKLLLGIMHVCCVSVVMQLLV